MLSESAHLGGHMPAWFGSAPTSNGGTARGVVNSNIVGSGSWFECVRVPLSQVLKPHGNPAPRTGRGGWLCLCE